MDETTNPEAPEVEELEVVEEAEADSAELDEDGNPIESEPEDDSEEIEHEGQKHRIPKALKDAFLMQSDYTRKTQAVAQERQALEAERAQFQQLSQAELNAQAAVIAIDHSLTEYNAITAAEWDAWEDSDPSAAQKAWRHFQMLQGQRNNAVTQFGQARQQRTFQEQQQAARRLEDGAAKVAQAIPDWSEKGPKVLDFGTKTYGFSPQELDSITDHRYALVLHDAYLYRQGQAKTATTRKIEQQQTVKPAAKVKGATPTFKGLDDRMSADAWLAARNKQVANRNR